MSLNKRKKIGKASKYNEIELNIMPFIDVFSILNTFLLMAAVFISIGFHEVQVPFLSSAPPEKKVPTRAIALRVELEKAKILLRTDWSPGPRNEEEFPFDPNEAGIAAFHRKLIEIRTKNPDTDLLTLFIDDDVNYEQITKVLDAIKLVNEDDPPLPIVSKDEDDRLKKGGKTQNRQALYDKVVFGSVVL